MVKNLPAMEETWVWSLGQEDPLEKGMATHSSILAWRILQTWGSCPRNGGSILIRWEKEESSLISWPWKDTARRQLAIYKLGSEFSSDMESASALSWTSPPELRDIHLLSKLPALWCSVVVGWADWDTMHLCILTMSYECVAFCVAHGFFQFIFLL